MKKCSKVKNTGDKIGIKNKSRREDRIKIRGSKEKGESLIENLISMFLIVTVILPLSDLLLKTYSLNVKVDNGNRIISENMNMTELIKTRTYSEMEALEGEHWIEDMDDFYKKFYIEAKYQAAKGSEKRRRSISIKKTPDYYINNNGDKEYIFLINTDGITDYYFPDIKE